MKTKIENILVFGDSLSDRGTMARSALAAFSGLVGHSPHGRFTNGYVWLDYFIQQLTTNAAATWMQPAPKIKKSFFSINNDEYVGTKTVPVLARTYCKGGLTAHDYSVEIRTGKCILNVEAQVLATLDSMRAEALTDDQYMNLQESEKQSTLVIEWSGANDLITINTKPTIEAARLAVEARINHLEIMITHGYRHFVLFNLPDLSLTPRFQNGNADLREQAHESVEYFNQLLQDKIGEFNGKHTDCKITIFDVNALFIQAYNHPDQFGLDKNKRHDPFLKSRAFKDNDPTTTAEGYPFWDEVHPTEKVQVQIANKLTETVFAPNYEFQFAQQSAVRQFQKAYGMRWEDESHGTCGAFKTSTIDYLKSDLKLEDILRHEISNHDKRTHKVIEELGWVDKNNQFATDIPYIAEAWSRIKPIASVIEPSTTEELDLVDERAIGLNF